MLIKEKPIQKSAAIWTLLFPPGSDGDSIFRLRMIGEDDMPAPVRTALTAVKLSIPIVEGPARARHMAGNLRLGTSRQQPHSDGWLTILLGKSWSSGRGWRFRVHIRSNA